jgi:integrase
MAGQIVKQGDKAWLVRIFMGRHSETGKRKYFNKTVHGTKKDAQTYLNGVLREKDLGVFIEPSAMTLNAYLDQWLETAAKPGVSKRTFSDYEDLMRRYVRDVLGSRKLSQVSPLEVQALYMNMQEKGLSGRTIRYTHSVLSSAFKQAVKWQLMTQNPAAVVDLPRHVRKEMKALSPDEAGAFLGAAAQCRWNALFTLALMTGMRPEEYLGLQWKDIDMKSGMVVVQRTLCWHRRGGGWYYGEPKTARSRRSIPLPASAVVALKQHHRNQAEDKMKSRQTYADKDIVFATREGEPLTIAYLHRRHFKKILTRAELPSTVRLYDLRHTCATLLLAANENPKIVSERLGHATITLTLDTYSHVLPSMQRAASDKLENILFPTVGTVLAQKKKKATRNG